MCFLWSETGRIRFRRARFQTPSSVSFFPPHRVPGRELSEFLSAYYLNAKATSPSFFAELTECAAELSEAQWVLFPEAVLLKQYSARFLCECAKKHILIVLELMFRLPARLHTTRELLPNYLFNHFGPYSLGSVFGIPNFSRISIFEPPDCLLTFWPDFSPHYFLWETVPRKNNPPGKSPAKSSKICTTRSPTHFCRGAGPAYLGKTAWPP